MIKTETETNSETEKKSVTSSKPWRFQPGNSANPGGRPRLEKQKLFLALRLEEYGFDWVGKYKKAIEDHDKILLEHFAQVMPYLSAVIHVKEFTIKPDTQEESKSNVDEMLVQERAERMKAIVPTAS